MNLQYYWNTLRKVTLATPPSVRRADIDRFIHDLFAPSPGPRPRLSWGLIAPIAVELLAIVLLAARHVGFPVPVPIAISLAFIAALLCPGLLLSRLLLRRGELDNIELFA